MLFSLMDLSLKGCVKQMLIEGKGNSLFKELTDLATVEDFKKNFSIELKEFHKNKPVQQSIKKAFVTLLRTSWQSMVY